MNMNYQRLISGALHDGILTQIDIEPARRTTRSRDKLISIIYCNHIHVPLFQELMPKSSTISGCTEENNPWFPLPPFAKNETLG